MNTLAIQALQNRCAPLPMNLHIGFCVLATLLFLLIYLRTKKLSNIYWLLICDATIILQWYGDPITAAGIGICEIVLFVILILELRKEKRADAQKAEAEQKAEGNAEPEDDLSDIAKVVKNERKQIINEKIDVIGEAFEDENND